MKILRSKIYMNQKHRICCKCDELLPIFMFAKSELSMTGHISKCKKCVRAEKRKSYQGEEPKRKACHAIVQLALKADIINKQPCAKCGSSKNVHAHHKDYNKPLNIHWLCPTHHAIEHQTLEFNKELSSYVDKSVENEKSI